MATHRKTVAFFGASTGVGLSALKHTLATGHRCIALCRIPSKLTAIFPPETTPNLQVVQGNAHDIAAVSKCLVAEKGKLVDEIISTIGGKFILSKMTIDDKEVCSKGITTILEALAQLRSGGATGKPHIVVASTTGMSRFGRDVPLAMIPLYHVMLKVPHEDKKVMEDRLVESGEAYTIIRASLLVDGETSKEIRVGIEDPKTGRESNAIGYTISREDTGKWVADNLVLQLDGKYFDATPEPGSGLGDFTKDWAQETRDLWNAARQPERLSTTYRDYAFSDDSLESMYGYEPWRLERLRALKAQYDPNNRFAYCNPITL